MKKYYFLGIIVVLLGLMQSCMVSQRPNIAFFDQANYDSGNAKFMSVNVPVWMAKPFVKSALRKDHESEEVVAIVKKIKKIKILTVENGNKQMLKDFSKYLGQNNYQDWVTIKHNGDNVNIQAIQKGDAINKLMLLVNSEKNLVFIDVKGNFTPEDISRVINISEKEELAKK